MRVARPHAITDLMMDSLTILHTLPTADVFFTRYWNTRPFLVRDAIPKRVMDKLIAPNELAALAMEETARARLVSASDWSCRFGPFNDEDFADKKHAAPWSLLIQNVDQFHPPTAELLRSFNFAPRWLIDDVMVSFSNKGGGIGGHVDSYHVFLVQGVGRRRWTIGDRPVTDKTFIEGLELKILKFPVIGESVEVYPGDVIYVPPGFCHEGITVEDALTYSIGFLGPQTSEMLGDFGLYLSEAATSEDYFDGSDLGVGDAGFTLSAATVTKFRERIEAAVKTPAFSQWLASYLTVSTSIDPVHSSNRLDQLTPSEFAAEMKAGRQIIKPTFVRFVLLPSPGLIDDKSYVLGVNRHTFEISNDALSVIQTLMSETRVSLGNTPALADQIDLLNALYNIQALEFLNG